MSARNMAKRTAAGTLALAVCLGGGALALAGAANADTNFKFDTRVEGAERYGTAIAASKAAFPDGTKTDNVVLVNGFATVDGLTASYLAGVANAPILYVSETGADAETKAEIKRLGAKNVWLVGGTTVIPTSVETAIKGDGYNVTRINGTDRYETAKLVAEAGTKIAGKKPAKVFVASGTSFADALAVSPIAYKQGYAIALTEKESTSQFTKDELGAIATDNKILVGGEAVVSKKVQGDLSISDAQRIAGADRAVTANLVSDWAKANEGFSKANAALVGGTNGNGADSLVASALGAKTGTTLHFAGWDATYTYLKDHAAELTGKGFVFGGKAAVAGDQVDKAQAAAQTVAGLNAFKVVTSGNAVIDNGKSRLYTVSGLDDSKTYQLKLFVGGKVKDDGSFTQTTEPAAANNFVGSGTADAGSSSATISVVNGGPIGSPSSAASSKPVDGKITFTVTGAASGDTSRVTPVVYLDVDASASLNVDTKTGVSKESYGVGETTTFAPVQAADGLKTQASTSTSTSGANADGASAATVTAVGDGYFTASYQPLFGASSTPATAVFVTFKYDSNDSFRADGAASTYATFVKSVSAGDTVSFDYSRDKDAVSAFTLTNVTPTSPVISGTATAGSAQTSIDLSFEDQDAATSYIVYRGPSTASTFPAATADDFPSPFTKVAEIKDTDSTLASGQSTMYKVTDKGLSAGTNYKYTVVAVSPGKNGASSALQTIGTSATAAVAPKATFAGQTTATGLSGTLEGSGVVGTPTGDTIKIGFDKVVDALAANDTIQVKDVDGTVVNLINGSSGNAVFTLSTGSEVLNGISYPAGQVITVQLFATPTGSQVVTAGSVGGAQFPLTIVDQAGIAVGSANWSISGSSDVTIEQ